MSSCGTGILPVFQAIKNKQVVTEQSRSDACSILLTTHLVLP